TQTYLSWTEGGRVSHTTYHRRIKLFVGDRVNARVKGKQKASLSQPERKQQSGAGSLTERQPHKSRRRVSAEPRPVKASLTALIGEAGTSDGFCQTHCCHLTLTEIVIALAEAAQEAREQLEEALVRLRGSSHLLVLLLSLWQGLPPDQTSILEAALLPLLQDTPQLVRSFQVRSFQVSAVPSLSERPLNGINLRNVKPKNKGKERKVQIKGGTRGEEEGNPFSISPAPGWEESCDAAVSHLLRSCLSRSPRDQATSLAQQGGPVLGLPRDTAHLKKHITLLCERIAKGGRLTLASEVNAPVPLQQLSVSPIFSPQPRIKQECSGASADPHSAEQLLLQPKLSRTGPKRHLNGGVEPIAEVSADGEEPELQQEATKFIKKKQPSKKVKKANKKGRDSSLDGLPTITRTSSLLLISGLVA
ncbi:Protein PTHB1, partial [Dissostichus eleginoides]